MSTEFVEKQQFVSGQRFRLSKLGYERCPKLARRVGEIVKIKEYSASVIVRFDGNRNTTTIHKDYIELA